MVINLPSMLIPIKLQSERVNAQNGVKTLMSASGQTLIFQVETKTS